MVTHPLRFTGRELVINYSTRAAGKVRMEVQDAHGKALSSLPLADCQSLVGDSIEHKVSRTHWSDVSSLAGQTVRLRFDADLYSLRSAD